MFHRILDSELNSCAGDGAVARGLGRGAFLCPGASAG